MSELGAIEPLLDGELARMRESLRSDAPGQVRSPAAKVWVEQALKDLERLLDHVQTDHGKQGGTFAVQLRAALEEKILRQVAERVTLTDDTKELSLSVHVTPLGTFVDVRLQLGVWRQG